MGFMGKKIVRVVFPVVSGVFIEMLVLLIFILFAGKYSVLTPEYKYFIIYYAPVCFLIALIFQISIVVPAFCKYSFDTKRNILIGLSSLFMMSAVFSTVFAILVSGPKTVPYDFINSFLAGFLAFLTYMAINLHVTHRLCRKEEF